jgi:serine/threonine protein kinase
MIVFDAQRRQVVLGDSVGHGGEATVYRVTGQENRLAKIFEYGPRENYAGKLGWMVAHPPENPTEKHGHPSLAWPDGLIYDARRKLIGYTMPYIQRAVPLLEVFNPRRREDVLPQFDRRYLLRTAHNLSAALGALHRGGYVVGDLNESNVLVTPAALVTLIDTDSFQVREERPGGRIVVHPCPVGKPEYTAPELQGRQLSEIIRQPDHDSFALAVLIFQLLMEGSHPFRAQWLAAGDPPPIETRITNGAYPYVDSPAYPVRPPKNALAIQTLHPWLVELFRRCFVDGHLDPRWRPGPQLWARAMDKAEESLICCSQGHFYFSQQSECPYCVVEARRPAVKRSPARPRRGWANPPFQQAHQNPSRTSPVSPLRPKRPGWGRNPAVPNPFSGLFRFPGVNLNFPGTGLGGGAAVFRAPPVGRGVLHARPLFQKGAIRAWLRQRTYKSIVIGGGQGALAGMMPGAAVALFNWFSGDLLSWSLLMALGGAAGGLLRGWKPGQKLSALIDRYVGWKLFWEGLGLVAGVVLGGMFGLLFIWAVIPVILGLILGAQVGRYIGRGIFTLGSGLGWERIWAGFSALGFGALGFGIARLAGVAGLNTFGANLAEGLLPFASNGSLMWATVWVLAGCTGGAISGGLAGIASDLIGRLSGLVD